MNASKARSFSREDARRFYDRFGAKMDRQAFYEDAAIECLIAQSDFPSAQSVIELGCGTGRLAARLLEQYLPTSASYVGVDISSTMVRLATERLAPWADRATVHLTGGDPVYDRYGGPFDRFVSTYVFDLLCDEDIAEVLAAAHDCLENGGRLCVAGLTEGSGLSAITTKAWHLVHRIRPALVGGCRPLVLADHLPEDQWRIVYRQVVVNAMVPSEVLIAEAA